MRKKFQYNKGKLYKTPNDCLLIQSTLNFIENMLLYDKVRIKDVPLNLRTIKTSLYISALRISRGISQERYIEDLNLLKSDIQYIHNNKKRSFIELYKSSLNFSPQKINFKE